MTYGSGQDWMISDHDEGIRQMKWASHCLFALGVILMEEDTHMTKGSILSILPIRTFRLWLSLDTTRWLIRLRYSAGESEVILGKFLKQHNIPREAVVILTKTFNPDDSDGGPAGLVNQQGLSRKVNPSLSLIFVEDTEVAENLRISQAFPREAATRLYRCSPMSSIRLWYTHRGDYAGITWCCPARLG